jgi:hypothetical protein
MVGAFRRAVAQARREEGLCFASLLSQERILEAFGAARWRWQGWVYTPAVTVWVYLSQCLSPDHSCREAVAGLLAWRLARGERPCSARTGAYCTARAKIPEQVCRELMRQTSGKGGRSRKDIMPLWVLAYFRSRLQPRRQEQPGGPGAIHGPLVGRRVQWHDDHHQRLGRLGCVRDLGQRAGGRHQWR